MRPHWWQLRTFLYKLLCFFYPNERPSDAELIAYGRELERQEQREAARKSQTEVWIQPGPYPPLAAYEPPERCTGPISRPMVIPNPHGRYFLQEHRRYMPVTSQETEHALPAVSRKEEIDYLLEELKKRIS